MSIKRKVIDLLSSILSVISYKNLCRLMYFISYKRLPNLKNPKLLSEKIMWLAINEYKDNPLVMKCADKVAVRDYVSGKGYKSILNEVYGVWSDARDIDWKSLPNKFVMKCNHASGLNLICTNKAELNIEETVEKLNDWLKVDYWKKSGEIFYRNIPRKIICEKYIDTIDGKPPRDYKIFCSKGKAKFLFLAMDRINNETKFNFFMPDWTPIPVMDIAHPPYKGDIEKPDNLNDMLRIAENLSEKWGQVRVDFYNENGKIIFGEITFMHHGGKPQFSPKEYDRIFGEMIELN